MLIVYSCNKVKSDDFEKRITHGLENYYRGVCCERCSRFAILNLYIKYPSAN